MHHRNLFVILFVALLPALAFAASPKPEEPFFPIMAWNHAPSDPAVLKKMAECGLTVAGFVQPKDLDAVHAAGMKGIVNDPRVGGYDWTNVDEKKARENVTSLVKEVNDHPAVFGYYLRDEPPATYFAGLEKVASVVRELAPGKWPYINLLPTQAEPWQFAADNYQQYLDRFVETCKPPILSYDHYALFNTGLGPDYFKNLEQMRAQAKKIDVPFWNIVLATAHFDYREVTHADFRFQAYTTLAYGGRGISYFTYFAPSVGNYRMAPVDQFGNVTPTWYFMQNVNLQIRKLAPTMLKLTSDHVYHFGEALPAGTAGPTDASLLTAVGGGSTYMAGDFTHADGSRWVMVVNRDLTLNRTCQPQFRTPPKKVQLMSAYTGQLTNFEGEQLWLAPGQGCLLRVE